MDEGYTCETCDGHFEYEDDGYLSEAGFECHDCHDKRIDDEQARFLASDYYKIRKNYPTLDRDVARMKADPVAFYHDCKNPGAGR